MELNIYDELIKDKIPNKDLLINQKKKILEEITQLNEQDQITLYLIILKFCEVENIEMNELPFQAQQYGNSINIDLDLLPIKLKYIIKLFIDKINQLKE